MRWILLMLLAALAGCAQPKKDAAPVWSPPGMAGTPTDASATNDAQLIVTPSGVVYGRVTLVNVNARYVVVTYPVGIVPEVGRRLNVYRKGLKVAELRITGPQRDVNTVGDIQKGECQVGDEVRPD
jgi:hypothetical protein